MSEPVGLHVVLIDVGTHDFLSICHNSLNFDAKLQKMAYIKMYAVFYLPLQHIGIAVAYFSEKMYS